MNLTNETLCRPLTDEEWCRFNYSYHLFDIIENYIPLGMSGAGILLNGAFLYFIIIGMRQKVLSSQLYLFLANKALGDLLASISLSAIIILEFTNAISIGLSTALDGITLISYFSASITYLALSLTKLVAIKDPLLYRRRATSSLIVKVLLCSWPLGLLLSCIGGDVDLVYLFHHSATCKERYHSAFSFISAVIFETFYIAVVVTCSFVLYLVYKHENKPRLGRSAAINGVSSSKSFPKLLAGFLVYVLCYIVTLFLPPMKLLYLSDVCESLTDNECFVDNVRGFLDSGPFIILYSSLSLFVYVRFFIDPIVNVAIDVKLRWVIKKRFCSSQTALAVSLTEGTSAAN